MPPTERSMPPRMTTMVSPVAIRISVIAAAILMLSWSIRTSGSGRIICDRGERTSRTRSGGPSQHVAARAVAADNSAAAFCAKACAQDAVLGHLVAGQHGRDPPVAHDIVRSATLASSARSVEKKRMAKPSRAKVAHQAAKISALVPTSTPRVGS